MVHSLSIKVEKSVVKKQALIAAVLLATLSAGTKALAFGWNQDRDAAESAMQSQNYIESAKNWQDALKQLSGADDPRYGLTLRGLADSYAHEGNNVAAEKIYAEAKQKVGASSSVDEGLMNCLGDYRTFLNGQNRSTEANDINKLIESRQVSSAKSLDRVTFGDTEINRPSSNAGSAANSRSENIQPSQRLFLPLPKTSFSQSPSSFSINGTEVSPPAFEPRGANRTQFVGEYNRANGTHVNSYLSAPAGMGFSRYSQTPSASQVLNSHSGMSQSSYYSTPSISSVMRSYRSTPSASSLMRSYGSGISSSSDNANLSSYSTSSYSAPTPSVSQTIRSEPGVTTSSWYHH
jgi:hypothetical protein